MKLSLIVPVFNGEKYLKRCLISIIENKIYGNECEIIFVNDGSKDNSLKILLEYQDVIKNMKIITQKNKGVSSARNRGIIESSGEYLSFLDCDDSIEKNYINDILKIIQTKDYDLIIFGMQRIGKNNKILEKKVFKENSIINLLYNSYPCNKVIKKDLIIKNDYFFPLNKVYEDAYTIPKIYLKSTNKKYIKKIYYNYHINSNSITQKRDDSGIFNLLDAYLEINKYMDNEMEDYKKFLKMFKSDFLLKILPNNSNIFIYKNYKKIKNKLFFYENKWSLKDEFKLIFSLMYPKYYLKKIIRK